MSEDCSKYANSEDCYIYVDDKRIIRMQCIGCHEKNTLGDPWPAANGYGPWEIKCHNCGRVIHEKPKEDSPSG